MNIGTLDLLNTCTKVTNQMMMMEKQKQKTCEVVYDFYLDL